MLWKMMFEEMTMQWYAFTAAVALFVLGVRLARSFVIVVGQDEAAVVERWGRFSRTLGAGAHWLWPGYDSVKSVVALSTGRRTQCISLREQIVQLGTMRVMCRGARIKVTVLAFCRVINPCQAAYACTDLSASLSQHIALAVQEAATAFQVGDVLCDSRRVLSKRATELLAATYETTHPVLPHAWSTTGVSVRIEIRDVQVSPRVLRAIEDIGIRARQAVHRSIRARESLLLDAQRAELREMLATKRSIRLAQLAAVRARASAEAEAKRYQMLHEAGMSDELILQRDQAAVWKDIARAAGPLAVATAATTVINDADMVPTGDAPTP
jgi:regulator of protease activity HflC (stomatin/prohibitin superfamily)